MKPRLFTFASPGPVTSMNTLAPRSALPQAEPARQQAPALPGDASVLERRYPAMVNAIKLLWGYPEMNAYFNKLWLSDERAEPLDPEAIADLMLLARVHQYLVPQRTPSAPVRYEKKIEWRSADPWSDPSLRR